MSDFSSFTQYMVLCGYKKFGVSGYGPLHLYLGPRHLCLRPWKLCLGPRHTEILDCLHMI